MRRRSRPKVTATGRAYLELLRSTLANPPRLSTSEVASLANDLAQPRQPKQSDLFANRRQGR